jgi:hypothetical protein
VSLANVRERGGFLVGFPPTDKISRTIMWTEEDEQNYVKAYPNIISLLPQASLRIRFKQSGFRGVLNWYRNVEENWRWSCLVGCTIVNHLIFY